MREHDIARHCAAALAGILLLACASVMVSWWLAAPGSGAPSAPASSAFQPAATPAPAGADIRPAAAVRRPGPVFPAAAPAPDPDPWQRKAYALETENAKLRGRLHDMLNWMLENVRGTFPLPEAQMANLQLMPVDENMAVSEDLAEVLRLSDQELDTLDATFSGTRTVLRELEAEKISVAEPGENQVVLSIPPYAEEGQVVREELYGALKQTLGAGRFDRFLQVAEDGLDARFDYFGEADRTLEFEAVQDAASGDPQLFVRDERVRPSKEDPLRQDITASERIVTELPDEYYPYRSWLPDYVTRFARNN